MTAKKSSFDHLRDFLKLTRLVRVRDIANDREVKEIQQRLREVFSQRMEPSVSFVASGKPFKIDPALEAIAKPYDGRLKDLLEKMGPLPKVELPAGAEHWKDYPLREPRAQKHYDSVDDMYGQLIDGGWKISVRPLVGNKSTNVENYIGRKADGRDFAFKIIARSVVDPRVWLTLTFSVFQILQEARFECDSEQLGFVPQVDTCSDDALLDLCKVVIAGKLDRYTHPAAK